MAGTRTATTQMPTGAVLIKPIVSALVCEKRHVLMVQQGIGRERFRWNLPGGKAKPGETLTDTAIRETQEETGYLIQPTALAGMYQYNNRAGASCLRIAYHARVLDGQPRTDQREIMDVRWFHLDQLARMEEAQFSKPALVRAILHDLRSGHRYPLTLLQHIPHVHRV